MIYSSINGHVTYVSAAINEEELRAFGEKMKTISSPLFQEVREADFIELMQNEMLKGIGISYIFEHHSNDQAVEFNKEFGLVVVHRNELKDKYAEMLEFGNTRVDPYSPLSGDKRTLEQIYALDIADPWDTRTDDEKADAYAQMERAKHQGNITGESFAPRDPNAMHVTDINATQNQDGSFNIDSMTIIKFEDEEIEFEKEPDVISRRIADFEGGNAQFSTTIPAVAEMGDDVILYIVRSPLIRPDMTLEPNNRHKNSGCIFMHIENGWGIVLEARDASKMERYCELMGRQITIFPVTKYGELNESAMERYHEISSTVHDELGVNDEIFYRIEVSKKGITKQYMLSAAMNAILNAPEMYDRLHFTGISNDGCWLSSKKMFGLDLVRAHLKDKGMECTISYAVGDNGQRLADDAGAEVIDLLNGATGEEFKPRPWNGHQKDFLEAADGDEEKAWKKVRGKELLFHASPAGDLGEGTIIYITPKKFFEENNDFWNTELNIPHLLPTSFKPVHGSVNTYRSKNDHLTVVQALIQKGFSQNLMFTILINSLD